MDVHIHRKLVDLLPIVSHKRQRWGVAVAVLKHGSNVYFLYPTVLCHTATVHSSWARSPCPTPPQQERQTTTEELCRGISGTWSACTFLDQEGIPLTLQLHRGATPVSSSTTLLEPFPSHTSRTAVGFWGLAEVQRIRGGADMGIRWEMQQGHMMMENILIWLIIRLVWFVTCSSLTRTKGDSQICIDWKGIGSSSDPEPLPTFQCLVQLVFSCAYVGDLRNILKITVCM